MGKARGFKIAQGVPSKMTAVRLSQQQINRNNKKEQAQPTHTKKNRKRGLRLRKRGEIHVCLLTNLGQIKLENSAGKSGKSG